MSAFLWIIHLIVLVAQLNAVLHAGSQVTRHSLLNLCLYFNRLSRPVRSLFKSENVIMLVDSVYAEDTEALKSRTVLWFLLSKFVNLSRSKRFLVLT
jgi:hypothetical protein